jgi:hypothetical protein
MVMKENARNEEACEVADEYEEKCGSGKKRETRRERSVNLAFGAARACEAAGRAVANEAIPALGAHAIVHARLIFALLGLRATRRTNCTYTNAKFWR